MKRRKGDPRTRVERERRIRAMGAKIPDQDALALLIAALPESERLTALEALEPTLRFPITRTTTTSR